MTEHDTLACPVCGYECPPRGAALEPCLCPECGVFDVPVSVRPLRRTDRRRMWIWSVAPSVLLVPLALLADWMLPRIWFFGVAAPIGALFGVMALVMPLAMLDIYRERRRFSEDRRSLFLLMLSAWGVNIALTAITLVLLILI